MRKLLAEMFRDAMRGWNSFLLHVHEEWTWCATCRSGRPILCERRAQLRKVMGLPVFGGGR